MTSCRKFLQHYPFLIPYSDMRTTQALNLLNDNIIPVAANFLAVSDNYGRSMPLLEVYLENVLLLFRIPLKNILQK